MRGYYALIDDKAYELDKLNLTRASSILGEERGQTTVSRIPNHISISFCQIIKIWFCNRAD